MALLSFSKWSFPGLVVPEYTVLRSAPTGSNFIQRNLKSVLGPLYKLTLRADICTSAQLQSLFEFFSARRGGWETFSIFDPDPNTGKWWGDVYLGTGTGAGGQANSLRGKSTSNVKVFVDNVEKALTTDYTIHTGGGTDSTDEIHWVTNPASGAVIKAQFNGIRHFPYCIFDGSLQWDLFKYQLYNTGISIIEVSE